MEKVRLSQTEIIHNPETTNESLTTNANHNKEIGNRKAPIPLAHPLEPMTTNLRSRAFFRRTRRGRVLKVVREHYLRDDLPWDGGGGSAGRLEHKPASGRYLVLDTNVVLHQMDLLDHACDGGPCDALCNIIVLETVMEEVKHRSLAVFNRLRALINRPERRVIVFANEHHEETYVDRQRWVPCCASLSLLLRRSLVLRPLPTSPVPTPIGSAPFPFSFPFLSFRFLSFRSVSFTFQRRVAERPQRQGHPCRRAVVCRPAAKHRPYCSPHQRS